jgi:AcrR family transcriptional regulator
MSHDTSSALFEAARNIFLTEGLPGLSVRRVAEQAGCTTMAVYSRFGGKDGIVAALFDEGFERLAEAQRAVDPALPPRQRVTELCRAYLETARRFPHHYALMLGHFSGEHTPSMESSVKALATLEYLIDAVSAGLKRTDVAAAPGIAHSLFALCHGWASLERTGIFGDVSDAELEFQNAVAVLTLPLSDRTVP